MTERTPSKDSADSDWRDARLDALWHAGSAEEPSPALDAALFAAARREVASGPRHADAAALDQAGRLRATVAEATRPERWWPPLAAAAVIGAFAIGLLQLLPANPDERAVVTDMPAAPPARPKAGGDQGYVPDPGKVRTDGAPSVAQKRRTDADDAARVKAEQAQQASTAKPPKPGGTAEQPKPGGTAEQPKPGDTAEQRQSGGTKTATGAIARGEIKESARDASATMRPDVNTNGGPAAERVQRDTGTAVSPIPPPAAAQPAPGAPLAKALSDSRAGGPARSANTTQPNAMSIERDAVANGSREVAGTSAKDLAGTAGEDAAASAARSRLAASRLATSERSVPLPVADWIALIRRLRDEGNINEAAKEIAAFRETHTDADRLLPPDLRDWRPAAR